MEIVRQLQKMKRGALRMALLHGAKSNLLLSRGRTAEARALARRALDWWTAYKSIRSQAA